MTFNNYLQTVFKRTIGTKYILEIKFFKYFTIKHETLYDIEIMSDKKFTRFIYPLDEGLYWSEENFLLKEKVETDYEYFNRYVPKKIFLVYRALKKN